jgi:hypothetical protein
MLNVMGFFFVFGFAFIVGWHSHPDVRPLRPTVKEIYFKDKTEHQSDRFILKKRSAFGESNLAVVFGLVDNESFCDGLAKVNNRLYPNNHFFCEVLDSSTY